jgi:hypothetical protein
VIERHEWRRTRRSDFHGYSPERNSRLIFAVLEQVLANFDEMLDLVIQLEDMADISATNGIPMRQSFW